MLNGTGTFKLLPQVELDTLALNGDKNGAATGICALLSSVPGMCIAIYALAACKMEPGSVSSPMQQLTALP